MREQECEGVAEILNLRRKGERGKGAGDREKEGEGRLLSGYSENRRSEADVKHYGPLVREQRRGAK